MVPRILRSVRVPAPLWTAALAKARENDTTVSAVIIAALKRYVRKERS